MPYYDISDNESVTLGLATPPDAHGSQRLPLKPGSFLRQVLRWNWREKNHTFQFETLFTV
jgi:hypothetical protein